MIRRLYQLPDDEGVLRQISRKLDFQSDAGLIKDLAADLRQWVSQLHGLGLSAIQIGEPVAMFVLTNPLEVIINPHIRARANRQLTQDEGCLSIPGVEVTVRRPKSVMLAYQDEKGVSRVRMFTGLSARVVQHEYDHLHGRLITDLQRKK